MELGVQRVYTQKEALNWFMRNHEGSVVCVDGERQKECECYPDAEEFYGARID